MMSYLFILLNYYLIFRSSLEYFINCYRMWIYELIFFVIDYNYIPLVIMFLIYVILVKKIVDTYVIKKKIIKSFVVIAIGVAWLIVKVGVYIIIVILNF